MLVVGGCRQADSSAAMANRVSDLIRICMPVTYRAAGLRQSRDSSEWHLAKAAKVACHRLFSTPKAFLISAQGDARANLWHAVIDNSTPRGAGIPVLITPRVARHADNPGLTYEAPLAQGESLESCQGKTGDT